MPLGATKTPSTCNSRFMSVPTELCSLVGTCFQAGMPVNLQVLRHTIRLLKPDSRPHTPTTSSRDKPRPLERGERPSLPSSAFRSRWKPRRTASGTSAKCFSSREKKEPRGTESVASETWKEARMTRVRGNSEYSRKVAKATNEVLTLHEHLYLHVYLYLSFNSIESLKPMRVKG